MKRNTDPTDFSQNEEQTIGTGNEGTQFGGDEGGSILNRQQRRIAGVLFSFSKISNRSFKLLNKIIL